MDLVLSYFIFDSNVAAIEFSFSAVKHKMPTNLKSKEGIGWTHHLQVRTLSIDFLREAGTWTLQLRESFFC